MNVVIGILILVVTFGALYYMNQAGLFQPLTNIFSAIDSGFGSSYSIGGNGSVPPSSVHYHEASIRFVSLGGAINAPQEVDITAHPKSGGFDVSGWSLKTDKGTFAIPKVQNLYSPSTPGVPPEDIFMRDGDRLAVYSGVSPTKQNERVTQSEYHVWLGDFLAAPHGKIILRDEKGYLVDQYTY
jgi:hypothetical protein